MKRLTLLMLLAFAFSTTLQAEAILIPVGSKIVEPDGSFFLTSEPQFLIDRPYLEEAVFKMEQLALLQRDYDTLQGLYLSDLFKIEKLQKDKDLWIGVSVVEAGGLLFTWLLSSLAK